jgi:hypothetical protein
MAAQPVTPHYPDVIYAELIGSFDPRFDALRLDIIKKAGTNETIDSFSRTSVLLQNNYSQPILGYTIRWNAIDAIGQAHRFNQIFWQRLSLAAVEGEIATKNNRKVQSALTAHVILPGSARLLSPFFNISRHSDVANFGLSGFMGPADFPQQMVNASSIEVTLDAIVYGGGVCEGKDLLNLCSSIRGQIAGISALIDDVKNKRAQGLSIGAVLDELSVLSPESSEPTFPGSTEQEWAAFARDLLREQVLQIRKGYGDEAAFKELLEAETAFRIRRR